MPVRNLSEYASCEVAWSKPEIQEQAQESNRTHLLRRIRTYQWPKSFTLDEYLEISKDELAKAAGYCGALLIGYEVGKAKIPPERRSELVHLSNAYYLPRGYSFVAKVELVIDTKKPSHDKHMQIYDGIRNYTESAKNGTVEWRDPDVGQFIEGTNAVTDTTGLFMVDPDLLVSCPVPAL